MLCDGLACKAGLVCRNRKDFSRFPFHKAPSLYSFVYQAASESDLDANDNTGDEGSAWAVSSNDLPSQVPPSSMVGVVPSMVGLVRSMMGVVPRMGVIRGGGTWHSGGGTYVVCMNSAFCQLKKITIAVRLLAPVCNSGSWGHRGIFP